MAVVVVRSGPLAGRRIDVDADITLGREDTDVVIEDDDEVSRRHAVLRPTDTGVEIEDLDSTNGTFVNERLIEGRTALDPGDWIRIGQTTIEVEAAPGAADTVVTEIPADLKDRTPARRTSEAPADDAQEDVATASLPSREPARHEGAGQRDLRPWIAAVVLIVLAVAAYLLFFGGDDFASAADDVCSPAAERVERLEHLSAESAAARDDLRRLKRIRTSTFNDLRKLEGAEEGRNFFSAFGQTQRAISGMIAAPERPDPQRITRQAFDRTARAERRAAEELGLGSCAQLTGV